MHLHKKETQNVIQNTSTQKSVVYITPFTNIFSRLQTSGSCKSCG